MKNITAKEYFGYAVTIRRLFEGCTNEFGEPCFTNKETGEKESEATDKRGTATGSSAEKRVRKTVENPTETGSALRKTGEETAEMGNVETTVSGAVSKIKCAYRLYTADRSCAIAGVDS